MDNRQALPKKTELAGDYRIKGILGAGGFGVTYIAEETSLDRDVAIKEYFPAEFAEREETLRIRPKSASLEKDYKWGLDRFVEEAKTLAKFNHANIVRVYRYFLENESAYMVLHLEQGKTFKKWVEQLKRKPTQLELVSVIAPLLNALELIHSNDFLHRDITPDNIMIRHNGSPVLIDFGSARGQMAYGSKTVSALIKPGYSPFEQYAVTSKKQGPWTDIYSLGATLYQAVTGRRPMDAPTRLVNDELIPAIECATGYAPAFLKAIDRSLCIPINKRPQSIAEWRDLFRVEKITQTPVADVLSGHPSDSFPDSGNGDKFGLLRLRNEKHNGDSVVPVKKKKHLRATVKLSSEEEKGPVARRGASLMSRINNVQQPENLPAEKRKRRSSAAKPSSSGAKKSKPDSDRLMRKFQLKSGIFLQPFKGRKKYKKKKSGGVASKKSEVAVANPKIRPKAKKKSKSANSTPRKKFSLRPKIHALTLALLFLQFTGAVGIASAIVYFQDLLPTGNWVAADSAFGTTDGLELVATLDGHREAVTAITLSADGTKIVSGSLDKTVRIWDLTSHNNTLTIYSHTTGIAAVAVHDRFLLSADRGGKVILTDIENGSEIKVFQSVDTTPSSIAFTGKGNRFLTAGQDAIVRLWDGQQKSSNKPRRSIKAHKDPITSLAYSKHRGLLVTGSSDNTFKLWRASNSRLIRTYRGHKDNVEAIAISPDGRKLATASQDGAIKIWSTRSRRVIHTLKGHTEPVNSVAFSPDGILLAAGSKDPSVTIWNLKTGHLVKKFNAHHGSVNSVEFSTNGEFIVSGGDDNKIRIWNLMMLKLPD